MAAAACLALGGTAFAQNIVLKKLLIADTDVKVTAIPADRGGDARVVVEDLPVLAGPDFPAAIAPFFGQPITTGNLNLLLATIRQYAIKHDRLVDIPPPPLQDVSTGILRLAVTVTRYSGLPEIPRTRWFSNKLLREKLGIKPGDEISIARLDEAVNWANTNPFRRVQVAFIENQPGKLYVGVQESLPLRLIASYDDTGNEILGKRHYNSALVLGNVLGLDHQLTYQFSTTDHQHVFRAHSLGYQIPLPWRHRLDISASYLAVDPTFSNGNFEQKGRNIDTSIRYTVPLRGGVNPVEWYAGLAYKNNNNNLAYVGSGYSFSGFSDIFEATTGLSIVRRDPRGVWLVGATLNLSPGNVNSRNTDDAFQGKAPGAFTGRVDARAQYAYGNFSVQRLQNLDRGWQWVSRGTLQLSTANLLGSEQISIGGSATVRGFDERIISGDQGAILSNDLLTPTIKTKLKHIPEIKVPLETRFALFYDIGRVRNRYRTYTDQIYDPNYVINARKTLTENPAAFIPMPPYPPPLASTGFGVRMNLGTALSINADYGWQLTRLAPGLSKTRNRGHVKVVLAY